MHVLAAIDSWSTLRPACRRLVFNLKEIMKDRYLVMPINGKENLCSAAFAFSGKGTEIVDTLITKLQSKGEACQEVTAEEYVKWSVLHEGGDIEQLAIDEDEG